MNGARVAYVGLMMATVSIGTLNYVAAEDASAAIPGSVVSARRSGVRFTAAVDPAIADVGEKIWIRGYFKNESADWEYTVGFLGTPDPMAFGEVSLREQDSGRAVPYTEKGKWLCDPEARHDTRANPLHQHFRLESRRIPLPPGAEIKGEHDFELTELFRLDTPGRYSLTLSRTVRQADRFIMIKLPPLTVTVVDKALVEAEERAEWSPVALGLTGKAFAIVKKEETDERFPDVRVHIVLKNVSADKTPAIQYWGIPDFPLWSLRWKPPSAKEPIDMSKDFALVPEFDDTKFIAWLDPVLPGEERRFQLRFRYTYWKENGTHTLFLSRRVFFRPDSRYNGDTADGKIEEQRLDLPPVTFTVQGMPTDLREHRPEQQNQGTAVRP